MLKIKSKKFFITLYNYNINNHSEKKCADSYKFMKSSCDPAINLSGFISYKTFMSTYDVSISTNYFTLFGFVFSFVFLHCDSHILNRSLLPPPPLITTPGLMQDPI